MSDPIKTTMEPNFEHVISMQYEMDGGIGKPPPLIVSKPVYDFFIEHGCPARVLKLIEPIPVLIPKPQPKDWYRKL